MTIWNVDTLLLYHLKRPNATFWTKCYPAIHFIYLHFVSCSSQLLLFHVSASPKLASFLLTPGTFWRTLVLFSLPTTFQLYILPTNPLVSKLVYWLLLTFSSFYLLILQRQCTVWIFLATSVEYNDKLIFVWIRYEYIFQFPVLTDAASTGQIYLFVLHAHLYFRVWPATIRTSRETMILSKCHYLWSHSRQFVQFHAHYHVHCRLRQICSVSSNWPFVDHLQNFPWGLPCYSQNWTSSKCCVRSVLQSWVITQCWRFWTLPTV